MIASEKSLALSNKKADHVKNETALKKADHQKTDHAAASLADVSLVGATLRSHQPDVAGWQEFRPS
jgi:hypothetical protein